MKALQQKQWLNTGTATGALGIADGHTDKPLPVMDWSHLALPPYLRCAADNCERASCCTNPTICLARPSEGVDASGRTVAYDDDGLRSYALGASE